MFYGGVPVEKDIAMWSALEKWLSEIEDALSRMIQGVFRFIIDGLPRWIYRVVVETVGPVVVRASRVLVLSCLWLAILFGPLSITIGCDLPGWCGYGSTLWLGLAIVGSMWGLNRLAKKRKADLVASTAMGSLTAPLEIC